MPALNEEANIAQALISVLEAFDRYSINGEILAVNDGSTDGTQRVIEEFMRKHPDRVFLVRHDSPQGIGASFWDGVDHARAAGVVMLPGDNENDPGEIFRYVSLLDHVDIVVPFLCQSRTRTLARKILSFLFRAVINLSFGMNFNYTNGTVIYRRSVLLTLKSRSSGFFYQSDILIRLVKQGFLFAEVPYRLGQRKSGVSKALTLSSLRKVMAGYLKLVRDIYFSKSSPVASSVYPEDSQTARRLILASTSG
jgi:glycosyltransferase involved in cell wall biosynthesis